MARFRLPRGLLRMCVLAGVAASVTGCVGMPSGGPASEFPANPQDTAPDVNLIGQYPAGPLPNGSPSQIVQGFLLASASYPYYKVAWQYLASSAITKWNPGWAVKVFSTSTFNVPKSAQVTKPGRHGTEQASVDVTGMVQASYDGSGQYVSAQSQGQADAPYTFKLKKVGGQWRIENPPNYRMLPADDFSLFYNPQDLYFFDSAGHVLIPDSVFVPLGVTGSQLLDNLVSALSEGPKTPWLENAADTEFPPGANGDNDDVLGVTPEGTYVTVNLGGRVAHDAKQLPLIAAQLVWTLTGSLATSSLPNIQSVELEINGQPWTPRGPPCPGGPHPGIYQTRAAYECFNPYPSSSTSFYYTDDGQAWARCGSEQQAASQGLIGSVVPVVARTGDFSSEQCGSAHWVNEQSTATPSTQPQSLPAASMVSVSPDGRYLAVVSPGRDALYIGKISGDAVSFPHRARLSGPGIITALSWDRSDNLWVAQSGNVLMIQATGGRPVQVRVAGGDVSDLAVAPDGVRIAYISENADQVPMLNLAAIDGGPDTGDLRAAAANQSISDVAAIGPGLSHPASLAWYDADDLIVLNDASTGNTLWEVPVDGQQALAVQNPPGNATSITADGTANVLVAGVSGNGLEVSTGLEGPWYPLGNPGANPAYPG